MSGILGIWNLDGQPVGRADLSRLCATLAHRGDHEELETRGPVGLACRLARITPEAATESQPVVDTSGAILVFDGRLDNREELLAALPAMAADSPDSALALAAYRTFGDGFPERLNGDFALGLFDPSRRKILLARDPIGLRPIYYYAGRTLFLFASEIKALLAHPEVVSKPDDDVLADLLFRRLANADDRGATFFQNIFSVLPAHLAIITPEAVSTRRYWDFDLGRQVRFSSFEESAEAFRWYFDQAVRRRLRSTAPVAVSVSGGLDSSSIFCVAETLRCTGRARHPAVLGVSYTSPDGSPSDEKAFLNEIDRAYGLEIARVENLPVGIMDACEEAIWHAEAPLLDGQWNSTHAYLDAVRRLGARVLLTGHWGDQFLFSDAYLVDLCRSGTWLEAWRHVNEYSRSVDVPGSYFMWRLCGALVKEHAPGPVVSALRRVRDGIRPRKELRPWYTDAFRSRASRNGSPRDSGPQSASAHARSLYREARSRYHVLCMEWNNKIAAMHGLELAFPFLDRDLIAFLMAIPGEVQSRNGVYKALLRQALRGVLPEAIAGRVSKADFTSVVNDGMARDYDRLVARLGTRAMVATMGYVRAGGLDGFANGHLAGSSTTCEPSRALGDLVSLELWLQEFFGPAVTNMEMEGC